MAIKKEIIILSFFITLSLFLTFLLVGDFLNSKRQQSIDARFEGMYSDISDMQNILLISSVYNGTIACQAINTKLNNMDKTIWDAGLKLEQYRVATEEFQKSSYYYDQRKSFNDNEVTYLMLLIQIKKKCDYNKPIISFFYENSAVCTKCDDQSFVLDDIKREQGNNVNIFAFDADLNLTSVDIVKNSYSVGELPCVVINDNKYCGIQSKDFIMSKICADSNASTHPANITGC